ncbi:MAG TPA: zf-HC2 domain-containing protein [Candidatus Acidoferrales bacterium]|nr:zf-HC2 domain-containing protein [Candidatus Acidoferrales bacterium]
MATQSEFGHSACRNYEARLEDYLHGELRGADAQSVIEHWQSCPGCRARFEDAALSLRLLRAAEPSSDPGPGFARGVMARIRTAENEKLAVRANFWQPFVSFGWRFAATATLALMALVSYNVAWNHPAQPKVAAVRPTEGLDLLAPEPVRVSTTGDEVLMMFDGQR